ncbi:MAG: hypothetical protein IKQ54_08380 [Oscillospiraceae bacterium]|nr:hypothetical protein [Oscillospiraceae bacterium]
MKNNLSILLVLLLLLSTVLVGCTEEKQETEQVVTLPTVANTGKQPAADSSGSTEIVSDDETVNPSDVPDDSSEDLASSEAGSDGSEKTEDDADDTSENLASSETISNGSEETDDDEYEIISDYTVNVDGSVGFGGN